MVKGGSAPQGTKSVDPVTAGAIAIAVLPTMLPKIIETIQAWLLRDSNRTIKFKGKVAGQVIEFEGSSKDLQKTINSLSAKIQIIMSGKYALIIGNTEYTDSGLAKLNAPGKDAEDFARALQSADIAAFDEVITFINENVYNLNEAIEGFFSGKKLDDLLVFYFFRARRP